MTDKGTLMTPDVCTSFSCTPPQDHCADCHHAYFFGDVFIKGKKHSFEFNPRHSPTFVTLAGEPKKTQPGENHPVWGLLQKWSDKKFKRT